MGELFTVQNLFTLAMLVALQAVLGFDNLLYISMESQRVEESQQQRVRRIGVGMAIGLRIVLLYVLMAAIEYFQEPFASVHNSWVVAEVNVHALIVLFGGGFIIYTAMKEIFHMLVIHDVEATGDKGKRSVASAIMWIVVMNLVFSFDSILSAIALTHVFAVMAAAIVISGVMMVLLADHVAEFLKKNRMYEVLGLFVLFIVGIMLVSEGGHLAHLAFFGYKIEAMAKSTFYFVLVTLVIVDLVQGRYQRKILAEQAAIEASPERHAAAGSAVS